MSSCVAIVVVAIIAVDVPSLVAVINVSSAAVSAAVAVSVQFSRVDIVVQQLEKWFIYRSQFVIMLSKAYGHDYRPIVLTSLALVSEVRKVYEHRTALHSIAATAADGAVAATAHDGTAVEQQQIAK